MNDAVTSIPPEVLAFSLTMRPSESGFIYHDGVRWDVRMELVDGVAQYGFNVRPNGYANTIEVEIGFKEEQ